MNIREQFKQAVVEALHGVSYKDAMKIEVENDSCIIKDFPDIFDGKIKTRMSNNRRIYEFAKENPSKIVGIPITLGRVIKAIKNVIHKRIIDTYDDPKQPALAEFRFSQDIQDMYECLDKYWKQNDMGTETDDDQTEECLSKILELLGGGEESTHNSNSDDSK